MQKLIDKFINQINQKSSFFSISLDTVIHQYENEIIHLEKEVSESVQKTKSTLTNYHYFNIPLFKKYTELSELYQVLAILVALKLVSKNTTAEIGAILSAEEVNKSAGKYRVELALGIILNTKEIPLITFRLFTQSNDFDITKGKLIQKNTEMNQFEIHACDVNKYFYLLSSGADFMCGGCHFQQGFDKIKFPQNQALEDLKSWINTSMYLSDFHEYLNSFIPNLNNKVIWSSSKLDSV